MFASPLPPSEGMPPSPLQKYFWRGEGGVAQGRGWGEANTRAPKTIATLALKLSDLASGFIGRRRERCFQRRQTSSGIPDVSEPKAMVSPG